MTAPRGGYQPPTNPAPVSGPGRLSRRTDGGPGQPVRDLPNPDYGEQATFRADQAGAPMAATPGAPGGQPPIQPADLSGIVPLDEPTQRPDEPVTAGAAEGAGPGFDALGISADTDPGWQYLRNNLPALEIMATMPMASRAFRQFVRRVRAAA